MDACLLAPCPCFLPPMELGGTKTEGGAQAGQSNALPALLQAGWHSGTALRLHRRYTRGVHPRSKARNPLLESRSASSASSIQCYPAYCLG